MSGVSIEDVPGKGLGLVATKSLPAWTALPFGGVVVNNDWYSYIKKNRTRRRQPMAYVVHMQDANEIVHTVDSHPIVYRRKFPNEPSHGWLGAFVNEPSGEQMAENALLVTLFQPKHIALYDRQDYPAHDKEELLPFSARIAIVLFKDVQAGEEITIDYGRGHSGHEALKLTGYIPNSLSQLHIGTEYYDRKVAEGKEKLKRLHEVLHYQQQVVIPRKRKIMEFVHEYVKIEKEARRKKLEIVRMYKKQKKLLLAAG